MDVEVVIEEIRDILRSRGEDDSVMISTEAYPHKWVAMSCNDCGCVCLGEVNGKYEANANTITDALSKLLVVVRDEMMEEEEDESTVR